MRIWSNFSQSMVSLSFGLVACGARRLAQGARVLLEVGESFLQPLERVPHSTLYGVFRRSGYLGNFLKRKVGDVPQEKDLALVVGKGLHCRRDLDLDLVRDRAAFGRCTRVQIGNLL